MKPVHLVTLFLLGCQPIRPIVDAFAGTDGDYAVGARVGSFVRNLPVEPGVLVSGEYREGGDLLFSPQLGVRVPTPVYLTPYLYAGPHGRRSSSNEYDIGFDLRLGVDHKVATTLGHPTRVFLELRFIWSPDVGSEKSTLSSFSEKGRSRQPHPRDNHQHDPISEADPLIIVIEDNRPPVSTPSPTPPIFDDEEIGVGIFAGIGF